MFNSTLIGSATVWFDKLSPESIDNYKMLRKAFLGNYSQQKKYIKDLVKIHHIKQREGESIETFMERFKEESMHVSGAPECMRISRFMHCITNPDLIKKPNDNILKSVDTKRYPSNRHCEVQGIATYDWARRKSKHEQVLRISRGKGSQHRRVHLSKESFSTDQEISFSTLGNNSGHETSIVIKTKVEGRLIHRMYVYEGSSVLYEHCFNRLHPKIKNQMIPATTSLLGFNGEISWPLGQISLMVTLGDEEHSTSALMNFMVVSTEMPAECGMIIEAHYTSLPREPTAVEGIKVAIHFERRSIPRSRRQHARNQSLTREDGSSNEATITPNTERSSKPKREAGEFKQILIQVRRKITPLIQNLEKGLTIDTNLLRQPCLANSRNQLLLNGKTDSSVGARHEEILPSTPGHADFIAKKLDEEGPSMEVQAEEAMPEPWTLFTDGSSCLEGSRAGLILTSSEG
nr:reverse transcriptase domain-containing protein [Tanacetum cinerariifolium]